VKNIWNHRIHIATIHHTVCLIEKYLNGLVALLTYL
jgi:hypothetical protein